MFGYLWLVWIVLGFGWVVIAYVSDVLYKFWCFGFVVCGFVGFLSFAFGLWVFG